MRSVPEQTFLRSILDYDQEAGVFRWLRRGQGRVLGSVAGYTRRDGYRYITIGGRSYAEHRLAWVWVNGGDLDGQQIDHADVNPLNNAIENLRIATPAQQTQNRRVDSRSSSGLKGAHRRRDGKPWRSTITIDGRSIFLGNFDTAEEAHAAYVKVAQAHYGAFARSS